MMFKRFTVLPMLLLSSTAMAQISFPRGMSESGILRSVPTSDFVNLYAYGGATNNNGLFEGDNNNPALTVGARTKNSTGTGAPAGLMAFGFNDRTTAPLQDNWAIYEENRRYSGAGTAVGTELDITEFGASTSQMDPYVLAYGNGNMSAGLYIQSGGSCILATPCYNPVTGLTTLTAQTASVGIALGNNGASSYVGLQFNYNAISGNDGKTDGQFGRAIVMPRGDAIIWNYCSDTSATYPDHCASNQMGAFILGAVKSAASVQKLEFDDTFGFLLANGNNSFMLQVPVSTSYVNGLVLQPSAAGTAVSVQATGSDTNINLTLTPKGSGIITGPLITPASAAATCAAGGITWDTGFVYICTAANTWKRVAIATW